MLDTNNPFVQRLLAQNPSLASQIGIPAPTPATLTIEQVRQIVDERLAASAPPAPVVARLAQFEQVFQKALSADDYATFQQYVAAGSPGFAEMLAGDKLHPIAQLLWETIKENKA